MKFILILVLSVITSNVFAQNIRAQTTQRIERENRPSLTSKSKVLYPFTMLTGSGRSYTFYEPASKIVLYKNGSVYYERYDFLGDIEATGWMGSEDLLVSLNINVMGEFRKGQKVCLNQETVYFFAGESLRIKDFYENGYLTIYSPGIFKALDSRSFAVHKSQISNCR